MMFIELIGKNDNEPMYFNIDNIQAIGIDTNCGTYIRLIGDDMGAYVVKESVREVINKIETLETRKDEIASKVLARELRFLQ